MGATMTDQPIQKKDLIMALTWLATLDDHEEAKEIAHQLILNWMGDIDIRAAYKNVLWPR